MKLTKRLQNKVTFVKTKYANLNVKHCETAQKCVNNSVQQRCT